MSGNLWIAIGAVLAGVAVGAGAIGTHVLKDVVKLEPPALETYDVAVRYQMYHALGLVLAGLLISRHSHWLLTSAAIGFAVGIVLFSGGIYAYLATGVKPFVHVVPIGGTLWIIGWLLLAAGALTAKSVPQ